LWNKELEDHVATFMEHALEVKSWDERMFKNHDIIVNLDSQVEDVKFEQKKLDKILNKIKTNNNDLLEQIVGLETYFDKRKDATDLSNDEQKREQAFALAQRIDEDLNGMDEALTETADRLSGLTDRSLSQKTNNTIAPVIKILNYQAASLQWVDDQSSQLGRRLQSAESQLKQMQLGTTQVARPSRNLF